MKVSAQSKADDFEARYCQVLCRKLGNQRCTIGIFGSLALTSIYSSIIRKLCNVPIKKRDLGHGGHIWESRFVQARGAGINGTASYGQSCKDWRLPSAMPSSFLAGLWPWDANSNTNSRGRRSGIYPRRTGYGDGQELAKAITARWDSLRRWNLAPVCYVEGDGPILLSTES